MKHNFSSPKEAVLYYMKRSTCSVQVGAVLWDNQGLVAAGWNHMGDSGFGEHAEINALKRANHKRLSKAILYVAGRRKKSKNPVNSRPCAACAPAVRGCFYVSWRDKDNSWQLRRGEDLI